MSFWQWLKTAASNANADGTINWQEGQPPSSVNDSGRAMMARLAEFRDDTSGLLVTGGVATAYTLTSNQGLPSTPNDGQLIAFTPNAGNGASPTLQVDGGTAFPIQTSPGVAVVSGVLVAGTPYWAKFSASASAWILSAFFSNPFSIPIGAMVPYIGPSPPSSAFVFPSGQAISRTTYSVLFGMVSTTFGTGDGSTTFNIIDMRGRIPAGIDNMNGGTPAGRIGTALVTDGGTINGQSLGSAGGSQNHAQIQAELATHQHPDTLTDNGHNHPTTSASEIVLANGLSNSFSGGGAANIPSTQTDLHSLVTGTSTTGITINPANQGSSQAMAWLQPTIMTNWLLRII